MYKRKWPNLRDVNYRFPSVYGKSDSHSLWICESLRFFSLPAHMSHIFSGFSYEMMLNDDDRCSVYIVSEKLTERKYRQQEWNRRSLWSLASSCGISGNCSTLIHAAGISHSSRYCYLSNGTYFSLSIFILFFYEIVAIGIKPFPHVMYGNYRRREGGRERDWKSSKHSRASNNFIQQSDNNISRNIFKSWSQLRDDFWSIWNWGKSHVLHNGKAFEAWKEMMLVCGEVDKNNEETVVSVRKVS